MPGLLFKDIRYSLDQSHTWSTWISLSASNHGYLWTCHTNINKVTHYTILPVLTGLVAGILLSLLAASLGNITSCKMLYSSRTLHEIFCCRLCMCGVSFDVAAHNTSTTPFVIFTDWLTFFRQEHVMSSFK